MPPGRLVFGSRNENTNRFGPTACWELTMTGITLGLPADGRRPTGRRSARSDAQRDDDGREQHEHGGERSGHAQSVAGDPGIRRDGLA